MITTLGVTTRVAFTGAINKQMTFGLSSSEYVISNIDGLGPVKAEYTSVSSPTDAGGDNLSGRDTQRNIVITMGFAPRYSTGSSVETLRRALRTVFMPKTTVELIFADSVLGQWLVTGKVETHEPDIFSKDPQVVISILCGDPYFYKQGTDAQITFNIPEPVPLVQPSQPPFDPWRPHFVLNNPNDVPTGFVYEGTFKGTTSTVQLGTWLSLNSFPTNTLPPEVIDNLFHPEMRLAAPEGVFYGGDFVSFSSIRNRRGVTRRRGTGTATSVMQYFIGDLVGMKLQPGPNTFGIRTTAGGFYPGRDFVGGGVIRYPRATGSL